VDVEALYLYSIDRKEVKKYFRQAYTESPATLNPSSKRTGHFISRRFLILANSFKSSISSYFKNVMNAHFMVILAPPQSKTTPAVSF